MTKQTPSGVLPTPHQPLTREQELQRLRDPKTYEGMEQTIQQREQKRSLKGKVVFPPND